MIWAGSSNQAGTSTTPQVDMRFVLVAAQKKPEFVQQSYLVKEANQETLLPQESRDW